MVVELDSSLVHLGDKKTKILIFGNFRFKVWVSLSMAGKCKTTESYK